MSSKQSSRPPIERQMKGMGRSGGPGPHRMMGPVEKPKNFRFTLKRVWHYFKREQHLLLLVFIFIILGSGLGLLVPFLLGKVADLLLLDPVDFAKLKVFIGILLGTYLLDVLTSFIQEWIMAGISERVVFGLRGAIFKKLQKLPISFFDKYTHGEIMSRLSNDVENVSMTISQSAIQLMSGVINILGALFMMLYLSPLLTGASMITIPLVIIMTRSIAKKTRKFFKQQQISLGALNGHIEESISGIQVVQAFNHEEQVIAQFNQINANLCDVGIKAQILSGFIMPLMNVINNLGFAVVALVGGVLAIQGQITVGVIVSFLSYSRQFSRPLNEIANTFNTLQSGVAGAERVFEVLDEQEESEDVEEAEVLEDVKGEVVFKNVTFGYDPKEPVLNNVSFHVKQGSNIALVGP